MKLGKKGWILFIGISLFLPVLAYAAFSWYNNKIQSLPFYGKNYIPETKTPYYTVPSFTFLNQDSNWVDDSFTNGKVWVAHYFYTTCPTICPKMMNSMQDVYDAYKGNENVKLISFTVDPAHDTPAALKAYADLKEINADQWQLLTGEKKQLYSYARKGLSIIATDGDGGDDDFIHSEKLVLIDRDNHIRGYYDGTASGDIKLLINDINRLLKE